MIKKVLLIGIGVPLALFVVLVVIGRMDGSYREETAEQASARIDRECTQKIPVWKDADGKRFIAGSDATKYNVCMINGLSRNIDETRRKAAVANAAIKP